MKSQSLGIFRGCIVCLLVGFIMVASALGAAPTPYADGSALHIWHLDETAGATSFSDTGSGTSLNVTSVGSPVAAQAAYSGFGTSVNLASSSDGLSGGEDVAVTAVLGANHATVGFTIEALVNFSSITGGPREIMSMDNDGAVSTRPFQFVLTDNGATLRFQGIASGGQHNFALSGASAEHAFVANVWYHVAVTYTGDESAAGNLKIYWTKLGAGVTAAQLLGTSQMSDDIGGSTGDFCIGNELRSTGGSSEGLQGLIDEVVISAGPKGADEFIFSSIVDDDEDGLPDAWEQQIVDFDAGDLITDIIDVLPGDDFDGDGLTNQQEYDMGSDPTIFTDTDDLDGDGLLDAWELIYFDTIQLQDGAGNPDGDIYTNEEEETNGTNPTVFDSPDDMDQDGLSDSWEQQIIDFDGGDAISNIVQVLPAEDFDADGFCNADEFVAGTDPTDDQTTPADTDADGLSDAWELENFGSLAYDGAADLDGDGSDNSAEETAATDPNDSFEYVGSIEDPTQPTDLRVDLLAHPGLTTIPDTAPEFTWIFHTASRGDSQSAYRIIVASSALLAGAGTGDVWDSGKVLSNESLDVEYSNGTLTRGSNYFWRVQTWGAADVASAWSEMQGFTIESTGPQSGDRSVYKASANDATGYNWAGRYQSDFNTAVAPVSVIDKGDGNYFIDFGKAGFGYITLRLNGSFLGQSMMVKFGEAVNGTSIDSTPPAGSVVYTEQSVDLENGYITYEIRTEDVSGDDRAGKNQIEVEKWAGGFVTPFRYIELVNCPGTVTTNDILHHVLSIPFDDEAASFTSSDSTLNAVYDLCKYSQKATSFASVYVDGDRERIPYEADAYLNQLCHYGVDREYAIGRYSYEFLLDHSTWPTEWKMHFPLMAWADYMYTGNAEALAANYDKILSHIDQYSDGLSNGLLNTAGERDIVDWPTSERDGYSLTDVNTVVNAFNYKSWVLLAKMAAVLGKTADEATFTARTAEIETAFNATFWNGSTYQDGQTATHVSAHANFFPMAMGLVPTGRVDSVMTFLKTKRMAPSVYGAQYLMEALFEGGEEDYAIGLMTDNGTSYKRHWYNMIAEGSTISMEAWGNQYKSNQDWNHAWGAVPANIIPRFVLGVKPLEAGFGWVEIKPQLGTGSSSDGLTSASGLVPTIRGSVFVAVENAPDSFELQVEIPGNMTANVLIPTKGFATPVVLFDGKVVSAIETNGHLLVESVPGGTHAFELSNTATPDAETLKENWKAAMFGEEATNPGIADDSLDTDGDGWTTEEEFYANTDPLNILDAWSAEMKLDSPIGPVLSTQQGKAGRRYVLERTPVLVPVSWAEVDGSNLSTDSEVVLSDESSISSNAFYRTRVELP